MHVWCTYKCRKEWTGKIVGNLKPSPRGRAYKLHCRCAFSVKDGIRNKSTNRGHEQVSFGSTSLWIGPRTNHAVEGSTYTQIIEQSGSTCCCIWLWIQLGSRITWFELNVPLTVGFQLASIWRGLRFELKLVSIGTTRLLGYTPST